MDDLIGEFISETSESLAMLDRELVALQQHPDDKTLLGKILRFAHTTKSACGFIGLPRLEALSEACELVLPKLRDGALPANSESATLITETLKRIGTLVETLANEGAEPAGDDNDLISQFTGFALKQRQTPTAPLAKPKPAYANDLVLTPALPTVSHVPTVEEVQKKPAAKPEAQLPENTDHALLDRWMEMVGELVQTRNQLQHVIAKNGDKMLQAPLQQLSHLTTELRESVMKARADSRVNSPQLSIQTVLVMESANRLFALPQQQLLEITRLDLHANATIEITDTQPMLHMRGQLYPLLRLSDLLQLSEPTPITPQQKGYAVVIRAAEADIALLVDQVNDTAELIVKPMSRALSNLALYAGTSVLGDESIALVLDANGIAAYTGTRSADTKRNLMTPAAGTPVTSFFLFTAGQGAPKAVPLLHVVRMAIVEANRISPTGNAPYEEGEIPLRALPGSAIPASGEFDILICQANGKTIGIVMEGVIDIIDAPLAVPSGNATQHYLGSTLIAGTITDVVDVEYLVQAEAHA